MIAVAQNDERQLQRLAAQRQLYASAKEILGWQVLLGGPLAVAWAVAVLVDPSLKGLAAAWGLVLTLADLTWLTPWQKGLRLSAAKIQEAFDCDVLELPWNDIKVGARPRPELVSEQSTKYESHAASMPPLTDWYPQAVDLVPLAIGRIACQRANCWWDGTQRKRYANWVIGIVLIIVVTVCGFSLSADITLDEFIVRVIAPLSPVFLLGARQYSEQREVATRLESLLDHCDGLWADALAGALTADLTIRSRTLQDEIFDNRRKSSAVFDFVFKRLRANYETQMNVAADELIAEATRRGQLTAAGSLAPTRRNVIP